MEINCEYVYKFCACDSHVFHYACTIYVNIPDTNIHARPGFCTV